MQHVLRGPLTNWARTLTDDLVGGNEHIVRLSEIHPDDLPEST